MKTSKDIDSLEKVSPQYQTRSEVPSSKTTRSSVEELTKDPKIHPQCSLNFKGLSTLKIIENFFLFKKIRAAMIVQNRHRENNVGFDLKQCLATIKTIPTVFQTAAKVLFPLSHLSLKMSFQWFEFEFHFRAGYITSRERDQQQKSKQEVR